MWVEFNLDSTRVWGGWGSMPFKFNTSVAIVVAGVCIALAIVITQRYEITRFSEMGWTFAIQHDRIFNTYCVIGPSNGPFKYKQCP
jgi:hypothetical protein